MYPSLFFGEPSRAELFTQRAEPSRALWFQKPSQNEPDFFLRSVDTEIKAKILNFMISIGPQEIFAKISISQLIQTHYDEVLVFVFKTDIDQP